MEPMPNKELLRVAAKLDGDALAAGSAVGFGIKIASDVEVIVSIVAGVLVAASAGLSIWLNWRAYKKEKAAEKEKSESE
jgi:hypothetical protein